MDQKEETSLEHLPLEIAQHILASSDDIFSLVSAALSSRFFYHAFTGAEENITRQVLHKNLNPALLNDAVLARDSSRRTFWSDADVRRMLIQYFDPHKAPRIKWKLSRAIPIAKQYNDIHYVASELASQAISQAAPFGKKPDGAPMPVSVNEATRIERMLYRFELYCNLFRESAQFTFIPGAEQRDVFFSRFSPWENEQLACVHDYLTEAVRKVIDEVSQHDPNWVFFFVKLGNGLDYGCIQHQLSLGVTHLRRLIEAKTYDARQELLSAKLNKEHNTHFLGAALEGANDPRPNRKLSRFTSKNERAFITRPLTPDSDPGPEAIWRWAHQSERPAEFSFSPSQTMLRKLAYVMWDMKRLEATGILECEWKGPDQENVYNEEIQRRTKERARLRETARIMASQGKLTQS